MKLTIFGDNPGRVKDAVAMFGKPQYSAQGSQSLQGSYILMDITRTYALGVHALRDACVAENNTKHPLYQNRLAGGLYRPLTFKETLVARLTDFNTLKNSNGSARTLEERFTLFKKWNDSCTGIAYQKETGRFKIIPVCEQLIHIDKDFNNYFLAVPYDSLTDVELDSRSGIYNSYMTKQQIEDHEGWRAALEGDVALLKNYRDAVFTAIQQRSSNKQMSENVMGFWIRQNTGADELRALFVSNLDDGSDADGLSYLINGGSFVRVAPSGKK